MEQENKEKLRKHILQEMDLLKNNIIALKKSSKPVAPENAIGRITRMEAINSKSIVEASLHNAEIKLVKLKRSLDMIENPEFGLCTGCGEPIPVKRLMIIPETLDSDKVISRLDIVHGSAKLPLPEHQE